MISIYTETGTKDRVPIVLNIKIISTITFLN